MAQPSNAPIFPPFPVIGSQFIAPKGLEIIVEKYPCKSFVITDTYNTILLKVKPHDTTFHHQRVLLDADDKPIAMLREKNMSMHRRWCAFKGESKANSDMIFSIKSEHVIQLKLNVRLMLASNEDYGFRLKGSWEKRNCTVYMGESSTAIAHMGKLPETLKYAREKFKVTIQPNMDYAGVVALLAVVDAMENPDEFKKGKALTTLEVCNAVVSAAGN